jgi:hypothetical protein
MTLLLLSGAGQEKIEIGGKTTTTFVRIQPWETCLLDSSLRGS